MREDVQDSSDSIRLVDGLHRMLFEESSSPAHLKAFSRCAT
jgi:hypothetical protein